MHPSAALQGASSLRPAMPSPRPCMSPGCCSPPPSRSPEPHRTEQSGRARVPPVTTRRALLLGLAGATVSAPVARARAAEESGGGGEEAGGVVGAIKSFLDPNETTKAGKSLPKAYLKAAREVVRTLRESLEEDDGGDMAKFRRNADAAKESIREFLGGWRGQQAVAAEESYVALEKAIRSLAEFYSRAGPVASLPQDVRNKILDDLDKADAYL